MNLENYKLRRTLALIGGNMKWDLKISPNKKGEMEVVSFHLSPISDLISHTFIKDENILVRPHQLNIQKFYENHKETFFEQIIDPELASDNYITHIDKDMFKTWDDTYWCGLSRPVAYSHYDSQVQLFAPVWIEQCHDIRFVFKYLTNKYTLTIERPVHKRDKKLSVHERFCDYFLNYIEYTNLHKGLRGYGSVDLQNATLTMLGLDVTNGNMKTVIDPNVIKNMISRERPMYENDFNITNAFVNKNLICPCLFNFNFIFDEVIFNNYGEKIVIDWDFEYRNNSKQTFNKAPIVDFFTNHHFIPRLQADKNNNLTLKTQPYNVLDNLRDYDCIDLMHKSKINQNIPLWKYAESTHIFNLYDGFGAYYTDPITKEHVLADHFNNFATIDSTSADTSIYDTNWIGNIIYSHMAGLEKYFVDPLPYQTGEGAYFHSMNGMIGSTNFNYHKRPDHKDDPDNVYIAVGTEQSNPSDFQNEDTGSNSLTDDALQANILMYRYSAYKDTKIIYNSLPSQMATDFSAKDYENEYYCDKFEITPSKDSISDPDSKYNIALYRDMSNKYYQIVNLYNEIMDYRHPEGHKEAGVLINTDYREFDTAMSVSDCYGLHIIFRYIYSENKLTHELEKNLYIIAWTPQKWKGESNKSNVLINYLSNAITLQSISAALKGYLGYYNRITKKLENYNGTNQRISVEIAKLRESQIWKELKTILDLLDILNQTIDSASSTRVVKFNGELTSDIPVSNPNTAIELKYFKKNESSKYVIRTDGVIKPAMYSCPVSAGNYSNKDYKVAEFQNAYGRNFLWSKKVLGDEIPQEVHENSSKGILPLYTSVGYDSVAKITPLYAPEGDLIYAQPLPMLDGYGEDLKKSSAGWPEYKWFDKSKLIYFPQTFNTDIYITTPEVSAIKDITVNNFMVTYCGGVDPMNPLRNKEWLNNIYNFEFNLDKSILFTNKTSLIEYVKMNTIPIVASDDDEDEQGRYIMYKYKAKMILK